MAVHTASTVRLRPAQGCDQRAMFPWQLGAGKQRPPELDDGTCSGSVHDQRRWQAIVWRQLLGAHVEQGAVVSICVGSQSMPLVVDKILAVSGQGVQAEMAPGQTAVVGQETLFEIAKRTGHVECSKQTALPGYEREADCLAKEISSYFNCRSQFEHLQTAPLQSVCVTGVAGVGKTTVINSALARLPYPEVHGSLSNIIINASSTDSADEYVAMALSELLERAQAVGPAVVVLDRLDALCDTELAQEMAGLNSQFVKFTEAIPADVFVVFESSVDTADMPASVKRCSALQHSQPVPVPTLQRREEIAHSMICRLVAACAPSAAAPVDSATIVELSRSVANATAGYVSRDISSICQQAFLRMLRRKRPNRGRVAQGGSETEAKVKDEADALVAKMQDLDVAECSDCPSQALGKPSSTGAQAHPKWSDFSESLQTVRPSQQMEFECVRPTARWGDIGGYESIKQSLQRFMRLATSESKSRLGIEAPSGILLYGPSGCGKTVLALAMIGESACNVIYIRGSELFSKYLGETEARLRRLFQAARAAAPCIVFMDEIDSIAAKREWASIESGGPGLRVLSTLLNEMDGVHDTRGVVAVGCTNRVERVDDAILRPGRFDQLVEVNMPTLKDRLGILQTLGRRSPLAADVQIEDLARITDGLSGAGLVQLFREAGLAAMRRDPSAALLEAADFEDALLRTGGA
ncbi:hypothetical protein GGI07_003747 [Coemansia sp. Benny D115]|nr:hypothetical protein GGI07_003747 [Coemansia sp. Benny D115]